MQRAPTTEKIWPPKGAKDTKRERQGDGGRRDWGTGRQRERETIVAGDGTRSGGGEERIQIKPISRS